MNNNDLSGRISEKYNSMSKGQKLLANYIVENLDKAIFLTAEKLGGIVGVSESTVVRFATFLGYKGYPEFQDALEELVKTKLNSLQRMEVAYGRISEEKILESVLESDAHNIKESLEMIDKDDFEKAVAAIVEAEHIYITGIRSCSSLASFLTFYLNLFFKNVHCITTSSSSEIFEQLVHIGQNDVIIGISFPRYSIRTLKALEFARSKGAKIIALTDNMNSPMTYYSDYNLFAKSDMASVVDSLVAPLSVINALLVAICMKKKDFVESTLGSLEEIWDEYQVYENDEVSVDFTKTRRYGNVEGN